MKLRIGFLKDINKIDKPSGRLTKKEQKTQINKIKNERGDITTNTTQTQRIVFELYCEQIFAFKKCV